MAKAKKTEPTIELDPLFPLPRGTGIPEVKQGQGREILTDTSPRSVVLPYRAFYVMWEHAEQMGTKNYAKYVGTQLDHVAQAALEAVHAFRSSYAGMELPVLSEKEAAKVRAAAIKRVKDEKKKMAAVRAAKLGAAPDTSENACSHDNTKAKKSKKTGDRYFLCLGCGEKLPSEAPVRPSEPLGTPKTGGKTRKPATKPQKRTQRPVSKAKKAKTK